MAFDPGIIESSKLRQLYDFWDGQRAGRLAPQRADIDPLVLPRDLIGQVFLYEVERAEPDGPPQDYLMRLFGTYLVEMFGRDLTGLRFDQIFQGPDAPAIRAEYDHAASSAEPVCSSLHGGWAGRSYRRYERLLLPLSEDDRRIDRLFGGAIAET